MKLTVLPFKATKMNSSAWRVTVSGFSGDEDAKNNEVIYQGPDEEIAKRLHFEALVLARVFPSGRGSGPEYNYSKVVKDLFHLSERYRRPKLDKPGAPFEWARESWSQEATEFGEESHDATIVNSQVEWLDEHGSVRGVSVVFTARESEMLRSIPEADPPNPYPHAVLIALIESQLLEAQVGPAELSSRLKSL